MEYNKDITTYVGIGQALSFPENGWRRYNDTDENIVYEGSRWHRGKESSGGYFYNWDNTSVTGSSDNKENHFVKFKFKGSKLRIITQNYTSRSTKIQIKIEEDIIESYSLNRVGWQVPHALCYEKTGLNFKEHVVEILNLDNTKDFVFDALDIDETGELIPYDKEVLSIHLQINETAQLSICENIADNELYLWTSNNKFVATVDNKGIVTAIGKGTCNINVVDSKGSHIGYIPVRVSKVETVF